MIPATAGSIVIAYNLPGVTELKLSREALAGIFLGKITKWNDPIIAKDNSGTTLPDLPISVAKRSDGSGTTFVFSQASGGDQLRSSKTTSGWTSRLMPGPSESAARATKA